MQPHYEITRDAHGQDWIQIGADMPPIPLVRQHIDTRRTDQRPRYIAFRADGAIWKECHTIFEALRHCRGSHGLIHDLRARRRQWQIRVIGPRGGTVAQLDRETQPPTQAQ